MGFFRWFFWGGFFGWVFCCQPCLVPVRHLRHVEIHRRAHAARLDQTVDLLHAELLIVMYKRASADFNARVVREEFLQVFIFQDGEGKILAGVQKAINSFQGLEEVEGDESEGAGDLQHPGDHLDVLHRVLQDGRDVA